MRRLSELRADVAVWRGLERRAEELSGLLELAQADADEAMGAELAAEAATLAKELDGLEFQLVLGSPYDRKNAILALHAGAGGTESQDWTEMLLRMYLRWAERRGFKAEVLDTMPGEEAGIKSVTVGIRGAYAYGYLKAERGVHRLVRLSPYDAAHRRHTSFALAEVMPEVDADLEVQVNPEDVKMEVFRSSGAGGQNVQKTSTAVRLIHIPTGMVVTCQDQRSQLQNKETAMRILQSRLLAQRVEEQEARAGQAQGPARGGRLGQPDQVLRPSPLQHGQGPSHRARDVQHRCRPGRRDRRVHPGLPEAQPGHCLGPESRPSAGGEHE